MEVNCVKMAKKAKGLLVVTCICMVQVYYAVLPSLPAQRRGTGREQLIELYFRHGYQYGLILRFLYYVQVTISLRQLKRILSRRGLRRRVTVTASHLRRVEHAIRVRTDLCMIPLQSCSIFMRDFSDIIVATYCTWML